MLENKKSAKRKPHKPTLVELTERASNDQSNEISKVILDCSPKCKRDIIEPHCYKQILKHVNKCINRENSQEYSVKGSKRNT